MNELRLLTVKQVADLLAICERHVWTLIANGTIRVVRLGRSVRVSESALWRLIQPAIEAEAEGTAPPGSWEEGRGSAL